MAAGISAAWLLAANSLVAQQAPTPIPPPVTVVLRLDATRIEPGQTTVARALAQVAPDFRVRADRIFSWNLDLLVLEPEVAVMQAATLIRPRSDQDPVLGSKGLADGSILRGVRDSFLNLDRAGVDGLVELFSVTLQAVAPGTCVVRLRAGTLGTESSPDFLVLPLGDEDPFAGGDYTGATATLTVGSENGVPPRVRIGPGANGGIRVEVDVEPGTLMALEEADGLEAGVIWRRVGESVAGNAVLAYETAISAGRRFYRAVRLTGGP